jgi:putative Mn2+ efflux pump MntP
VVVARLVAFVIPLGLDTFAVSAALGMQGLSPKQRLRVSVVFATFEGLMPALGLVIGSVLGRAIGQDAAYVAGLLLIGYSAYTLLRTEDEEDEARRMTTTHGWALVLLGLSVSLDELAVGFTLGLSRVPIIPALVLIAAQAFVVTQLGIRFGGSLSRRFRQRSERTAGVVLGSLGVWLLIDAALR